MPVAINPVAKGIDSNNADKQTSPFSFDIAFLSYNLIVRFFQTIVKYNFTILHKTDKKNP